MAQAILADLPGVCRGLLALDGWYGADASEIAIFVRGRAHTMGSVAPIEMSMGHDGRIEADITGALPYLEFEAVLDAAEGRVCGGAQEGSGLCQRLATIRTHLLHDHVAHKIDTVYQNARLADHRRSVTPPSLLCNSFSQPSYHA